VIQGVRQLHGVHYDVLPDRIEGGTYLAAAPSPQGTCASRMPGRAPGRGVIKLREAGASVACGENWVESTCAGGGCARSMCAPRVSGFPTDMQAQFAALDTVAEE